MEKDARYFLVGLFVVAGFAALIGFSIWLAGSFDDAEKEFYTVHFTDPVNGLKEGASVQYRGVDVGKVLSVKLDETRSDLIKADIAVDASAPIGAQTEAQLAVLGVTGLVYIDLSTSPEDTGAPPRMEGEKYPVIRGNGTQLAKLFQDIPTITKQVVEITTKLNTLLDEKNMGRMGDTLANIEKLTRDLNGLLSEQNVANAGSAIANANTTMENFSAFSQDAKEIVTRFEKTADEIESTVKSLNTVITNSQKSIGKFSSEGLDQLTATTRAAERMIESIREIADKLGQDPSQILYKPQNQGVEIPQ